MDSSHLPVSVCQTDIINSSEKPAEESDKNIKRAGIDLAKLIFQVLGVDGQEKAELCYQLRRAQMQDYF